MTATPDRTFVAGVTLRRKRGVPADLFRLYWRDVHGPVACRLPGLQDYWQHHLAYEENSAWPAIEDVEHGAPDAFRFDGFGEGRSRSMEDMNGYFTAGGALLMEDEPNLFEATIAYMSLPGNTHDYVDRLAGESAHNRPDAYEKFLTFYHAKAGVDVGEFRATMRDAFVPALAASDEALKLRLQLPEPHDNDDPSNASELSRSVSHYRAPEDQHQAVLQSTWPDRLALSRAVATDAYRAAADRLAGQLARAVAYRIVYSYRLIEDDALTLVGLRGFHAADIIRRVGAVNHLKPEIAKLLTRLTPSGDE